MSERGGSRERPREAGRDRAGPPIVSVVGWKDSGKTELVVRLVRELTDRGRRVMTLKHGHGFEVDTPGTDSWRHRKEGGAARVALAGPEDVAVMGRWGPEGEPGPRDLARRFLWDAEIVVAEGWKRADLPKIEVLREAAGERLYDPAGPDAHLWLAVVTDGAGLDLPLPVLDVDEPETIGRLAGMVEARLPDGGAGGPVS